MNEKFPYLKDAEEVDQVQRGPEPGGAKGAYRAFSGQLRGLRTTMARLIEGPMTIQYPEEDARVPALSGPPQAAPLRGHRAREVRRLLALRRGLPMAAFASSPRERSRRPGLARRALRRRLRDQPRPLHLLRLLRGRLPVRRDHHGSRYELADYNRGDLIFTKEMLLAEPVERTPLRREGE